MYEVRYVCLLQFVLSLVKFGRSCLFLSAALKILLSASLQQNLLPFVKTQNSTLAFHVKMLYVPFSFLLKHQNLQNPPCQITKQTVCVSESEFVEYALYKVYHALMHEVCINFVIVCRGRQDHSHHSPPDGHRCGSNVWAPHVHWTPSGRY